MGTCKLTMASTSLPSCLLLALSFLVSGVPARYSPGDYKPDIGDGPPTDYGRPVKPNCHWEQKTTFQDRCEDYDEKTCWTQNEEQCSSYLVTTCTPVVNTGVDRRCFNVTELICELVESVHYRQVEENFHVQSCYTTKDRVCDTVHEIDTTTKDDLQCVELESPNCHMEDKILVDKVCTDTVEFECSPDKKLDNAGYGVKDTVCREIPKHDCYDSPRTVQVEVCEPEYKRYCDKLTKDVPFPRGETKLPLRAEEDLPAGAQDQAQEGQGVLLHRGLQAGPSGDLRPVRDQALGAGLSTGRKAHVQVHPED